jgi:hypothetical protein
MQFRTSRLLFVRATLVVVARLFFLIGRNDIDAHDFVGVTGKEGQAVGAPGQTGAGGDLTRFALLGLERVDDDLTFQIPNLDTVLGGGAQPVPVGRKDQVVDNVAGVETVQTLAFVQVPEHCCAVLAAAGREGTVGRDADGVQIPRVTDQVVAQFAVGQIPHLDEAVPAGRHDQRHVDGRRKTHATDPFGMAVAVATGDRVFALAQRIPQADGRVASA